MRPHFRMPQAAPTGPKTGEQLMTKQQQLQLDAMLRQAPFDPEADVATLRTGFDDAMRAIPIAADVQRSPLTLGGVPAIEVTVGDSNPANVVLYFHGGVYVIGS